MAEDVQEKGFLQKVSSGIWGFILLRGLALVVLGVFLLIKPEITVLILVQFLGAYFFVDGVFTIIESIVGREFIEGWGWGVFVGILEILAGIVVFVHPFATSIFTLGFMVYFIAFLAMFFGCMGVFAGIRLRKEMDDEWSMILVGILSIAFGVLLLLNPEASTVALIIVMGVLAIIGGIVLVFHAFKVRKFSKKGLEAVL